MIASVYMLLKPLIRKEISHVANETDKVRDLPVNAESRLTALNQYMIQESSEYLQLTGRFLMLSIIVKEINIKIEKTNHDRSYRSSHPSWPICQCNYAKYIRGTDMSFSREVIENLRGVI